MQMIKKMNTNQYTNFFVIFSPDPDGAIFHFILVKLYQKYTKIQHLNFGACIPNYY